MCKTVLNSDLSQFRSFANLFAPPRLQPRTENFFLPEQYVRRSQIRPFSIQIFLNFANLFAPPRLQLRTENRELRTFLKSPLVSPDPALPTRTRPRSAPARPRPRSPLQTHPPAAPSRSGVGPLSGP